ncbi:hypothetical protein NDU88_005488, partial [Pleurodeles waltl]
DLQALQTLSIVGSLAAVWWTPLVFGPYTWSRQPLLVSEAVSRKPGLSSGSC